MMRIRSISLGRILLFSVCMGLLWMSGTRVNAVARVRDIQITNMENGYVLQPGRSKTIKYRLNHSRIKRKNIRFRSSRPKVARVTANGRIIAARKGKTTITVYNKVKPKQRTKIAVYVGNRIRKLSVRNRSSLTYLMRGQSSRIYVNFFPASAAYKKLIWSSSDQKVCSISSTGIVTAHKAGTALISAMAADGSKKKVTIRIEVLPRVDNVQIHSPLKYAYLPSGGTLSLSASLQPAGTSAAVIWSSSDPSVAAVSSNGTVTARGTGTAIIYASLPKYRNIRAAYRITVPDIRAGKVTLIAHRGYSEIAPENTRAAFKLAASNPSFSAVECDVHRTADGVFVINHDHDMNGMFGLNVKISDVTYDTIKNASVIRGSGIEKYPSGDVALCTLEDYLKILKSSNKRAVIELKDTYPQEISDELFDMISSYGMNERVDIISFSPRTLLCMTRSIQTYGTRHPGRSVTSPEIYLLTMYADRSDSELGNITPTAWAVKQGYHLSVGYVGFNQQTVDTIHNAGRKIGIWTEDRFDYASHYIFDMGVDCVTSNRVLFP